MTDGGFESDHADGEIQVKYDMRSSWAVVRRRDQYRQVHSITMYVSQLYQLDKFVQQPESRSVSHAAVASCISSAGKRLTSTTLCVADVDLSIGGGCMLLSTGRKQNSEVIVLREPKSRVSGYEARRLRRLPSTSR